MRSPISLHLSLLHPEVVIGVELPEDGSHELWMDESESTVSPVDSAQEDEKTLTSEGCFTYEKV